MVGEYGGHSLEMHDMLPVERQDALTRMCGIMDELLGVHEYPEVVMELVGARLEEWARRWEERGVRKGGTYSEFRFSELPAAVVEAMGISQQVASRGSDGGDMLPPGRRGE